LPSASPVPQVSDVRVGLSPMGEVVSWGAAAHSLTGYATDEIVGRNIDSIIPEPHAAAARTAFAALRGGGSATFETLLRRKDGTLVEIEIDAKPLPDGSGAARIGAVMRDLTQSRRAGRQIEERLRLALGAAEIGTYEIDLATERYALDARAAAVWGRHPDEILCYQSLAAQVLDEDRSPVKNALDVASDARGAGDGGGAGAYAAEFRIRRHNDGALRWVSLQGRAFFENGRAVSRVGVMLDVTDKKVAQEALEQAHARMAQQTAELDAIFEALNVPVTVYNRQGEIVRTNAAARAVWGITPDIQNPIDFQHLAAKLSVRNGAGEAIDPVALSAQRALSGHVVTGEDYQITSPSGLRYDFNAAELPLVVAGEITGAVSVWHDVTEHKRKDEQASILLRELSHRSKNLLSVIESILRQSAKSSGSKEDFVARFSERLHALANAHDLLARNNSLSVSMTDLIFSQVGHHWEPGQRRISMSGLGVRLKPDAAQMIGMALHELSTNAAKYGALSNQTGRVSISWKIELEDEGEPAFQLKWVERGGPPVTTPEHRGFGTTVIQRVAGQSLRGSATLDYFPEGVVWVLRAPRSAVLDNVHADSPRGERMRSGALEKLQDAWIALQRGGRLPRLAEMQLGNNGLRDNLIIAEVDHRETPPRVRFASVGKALTERLGLQFEGQEIELTESEIIGTAEGAYRRCLRSAKPGYEYAHFNLGQGRSFFFERLLLPLSEDGRTITHIVGMANFEDGLPAKPPR
jgi:PAS domain S-box-containing protein